MTTLFKALNIIFTLTIFTLFTFGQSKQITVPINYDFGPGKAATGFTQIRANQQFTAQKGFGFLSTAGLQEISRQRGSELTSDFITSDNPFYFALTLPDGNYDVKVTFGDSEGTSSQTLRAESRRYMFPNTTTKAGEIKTAVFTVHMGSSEIDAERKMQITDREVKLMRFDKLLTLEFAGSETKICALEIRRNDQAVNIFLAGNSTVCDWESEPGAAWGMMIPAFFKAKKVAVANYAESGETMLAFEKEMRLAKIWQMAKAGDYLFMEFAHNDQKDGINHLDAETTYKQKLMEWIIEARKRHINPVMVTSTSRRSFNQAGVATNSLGKFPDAMRKLAKDENIPIIDLNAMSMVLNQTWGAEGSAKAFIDGTHTNVYGAYELARCIAGSLMKAAPELAKYVKQDFKQFDPLNPDDPSTIIWPPGLKVYNFKPLGN
ncbi:rhamnogalacturonan acetylesterase [Mucilaginibacter terrae]|uniref:rhamnogalacturonan acetylesterase n=1 Tax=Mucilaginibacter terrae TaxID=1955052 RepID=UPI0036268CB2